MCTTTHSFNNLYLINKKIIKYTRLMFLESVPLIAASKAISHMREQKEHSPVKSSRIYITGTLYEMLL